MKKLLLIALLSFLFVAVVGKSGFSASVYEGVWQVDQRMCITDAEDNKICMENYQTMKNAGLKVFPTYRLGADGRSILMTSGNLGSKICAGIDSNGSLPARGEQKLAEVDGQIGKLAEAAFQQARLAADKDVEIFHIFQRML